MEKEIIEILNGNYPTRFINFVMSSDMLKKSLAVDQEFVQLVSEDLPALETLLDGASGKVSEKVLFEGILAYRLVHLVGIGKLPITALGSTVDYLAGSYDTIKKMLPAIRNEFLENEEQN